MERIKDIIVDDNSNVRVYLLKKMGIKASMKLLCFLMHWIKKLRKHMLRIMGTFAVKERLQNMIVCIVRKEQSKKYHWLTCHIGAT